MRYELWRLENHIEYSDISVVFSDGITDNFNRHNIYVAKRPPNITRKRKVTDHSFLGRNGHLSIDHGTWESIEVEMELTFKAKTENEVFDQVLFLDKLQNDTDITFGFYHEPFWLYKGRVEEIPEIQGSKILQHNRTGMIRFKLQPERYFNHGYMKPLTLKNGDSVYIPFGKLDGTFKFTYNGDISIVTGNTVTKLTGVTNEYPIIIDTFKKRTYAEVSDNVFFPRSIYKTDKTYPTFQVGETKIIWTGDLQTMELKVNWRL